MKERKKERKRQKRIGPERQGSKKHANKHCKLASSPSFRRCWFDLSFFLSPVFHSFFLSFSFFQLRSRLFVVSFFFLHNKFCSLTKLFLFPLFFLSFSLCLSNCCRRRCLSFSRTSSLVQEDRRRSEGIGRQLRLRKKERKKERKERKKKKRKKKERKKEKGRTQERKKKR